MADFSAKDAARSKHRLSVRHKPSGRGRGFGRGRGAAAQQEAPLEQPSWRYEEEDEKEEEARDPDAPPPPQSQGEDLLELLEAASQSAFFGRVSLRGSFEGGWGDEVEACWSGEPSEEADAADAQLLAWSAAGLAEALAPLSLAQLLDLDEELCAEEEAAHREAVTELVASRRRASGAERSAQLAASPPTPAPVPSPAPQPSSPPLPSPVPPPALPAPPPPPPPAAPPLAAPKPVPAAAAAAVEEDEDDAFLSEMGIR